MHKHKMKKTTLYLILLIFVSDLVMLTLLIITGNILVQRAEKDARDTLIRDNETIISNAKHLYDFDVDCLEASLNIIKKESDKAGGRLDKADVKTILEQNFTFFSHSHNALILDIKAVYDSTYLTMANNTIDSGVDFTTLPWYVEAKAYPNQIIETTLYEHALLNKKVFSYAIYDSAMDIIIALDIDCERIIEYSTTASIEDCFLTYVNGDGVVIATTEERLLGVDTKTIQEGSMAGFYQYMDYIKERPNTALYREGKNDTLLLSYYYAEADRFIITVYPLSTELNNFAIWLLVISGIILVLFSIGVFFIFKILNDRTKKLNETIESEIQEKEQLTKLYNILNNVVEYRSYESGSHIKRVQKYTKRLAEELKKNYPEYNLTEEKIENIVLASSLHDIGKIAIPDTILNKPAKLTSEEFEIMKTHSEKGAEMVERIFDKNEDYYMFCHNITLYHHERYDGRGYPCRLSGEDIPVEAQIVSVADVLDALVNKRCYKDAYRYDEAIQMILNNECGVFNPKLMQILVQIKDELYKIYEENKEEEVKQ